MSGTILCASSGVEGEQDRQGFSSPGADTQLKGGSGKG